MVTVNVLMDSTTIKIAESVLDVLKGAANVHSKAVKPVCLLWFSLLVNVSPNVAMGSISIMAFVSHVFSFVQNASTGQLVIVARMVISFIKANVFPIAPMEWWLIITIMEYRHVVHVHLPVGNATNRQQTAPNASGIIICTLILIIARHVKECALEEQFNKEEFANHVYKGACHALELQIIATAAILR